MKKKETKPDSNIISRKPFPNSNKIYQKGEIHDDVLVAMREITLSDTIDKFNNTKTSNQAITVYDTSGPYTDPNKEIDVEKGLEPLRSKWIKSRNDVEELSEISSVYGKKRLALN
ncbi:MAG: phosphomethylpyrimidine synthase ThiC, partial [Bacteroidia bacterium]